VREAAANEAQAQWTNAKTAGDREPLCKMSVASGDAPSRTADAPPARARRRMRRPSRYARRSINSMM